MSIWSSAKGTLYIPKTHNFSLRKYTEQFYEESTLKIDTLEPTDTEYVYAIHYSIYLDGIHAFNATEKWLEGIAGHHDVEILIRSVR